MWSDLWTMGTGSSVTRQHWVSANADGGDESREARAAGPSNSDLPVNNMKGLSKLVEAKNKFMKNRERTPACFNKQVNCLMTRDALVSYIFFEFILSVNILWLLIG